MDSLKIQAVVSGILFGIWPLVLKKSGDSLNPTVATTIMMATAFGIILPLSFSQDSWRGIVGARWGFAVIAGCISIMGMIIFNGMISKSPKKDIAFLIAIMTIIQASIPCMYAVVRFQGFSLTKTIGILLGGIAVVLLFQD